MNIKICGMKYPDNIEQIAALKPNFMGFIFYPKSPRFAEPLDADAIKSLPRSILKIGVFVDETLDNILEYIKKYNLNGVQLHGSESEELCYTLKSAGLLVLKAFSIAESADFRITDDYEGCCDLFVFDTKTPAYGGSGQKFDWTILSAYIGDTPFLLSGGIGPDDANEIKAIMHPKLRGIDLNSRFETEPGRKDAEKLRRFMKDLPNPSQGGALDSTIN